MLLIHTRFGVYAQVIGDNEAAARAMGVRVERHKVLLYALSGLLSGLAGLLFAARINSGEPTAGLNYELTAITATIIGGTNLFGGRGSVIGTMIGALIMGVLQNGLNLLAVQPFYQQIAIGAVLILAVWLDRINCSGGPAAMSLLELHDVRKNFGAIEALRGVTFSVEAGAVVGLVGDNGAGKSTLMKTITGVHRPDSGEIRFDGASLAGKDPGEIREAGIEMIYQDLALASMRDVASNIFLGRELTRSVFGLRLIDAKRMRAEAEAMIAKLGARVKSVTQIAGQLSGGQQQSVAIARALTFNPKLVIMDEPTAALAVREIEHVLELIRTLEVARHRGDPDQPSPDRRVRGLRPHRRVAPGRGDRRRSDRETTHERRRRPYRRRDGRPAPRSFEMIRRQRARLEPGGFAGQAASR